MALILVLAMVALIAGWAATAAYEDLIDLRRVEQRTDSVRAMLAAESGVALARLVLARDAKESKRDDLTEDWAATTPPFPVDGGTISGAIRDANRFFNLNDLVDDQGKARPDAVAIARRLFAELELDGGLVDALVDWMDKDSRPFGVGGVEEDGYIDRPYRIKNARLDRLEELLLVAGFDRKVVAKLRPFVIVRPPPGGGKTPVNINTAPAEVLAALFPAMSLAAAERVVADREEQPFSDTAPLVDAPDGKGVDPARLTVASDAFLVRSLARFGSVRWQEEQLIARQGGKFSLIYRQRTGWD